MGGWVGVGHTAGYFQLCRKDTGVRMGGTVEMSHTHPSTLDCVVKTGY